MISLLLDFITGNYARLDEQQSWVKKSSLKTWKLAASTKDQKNNYLVTYFSSPAVYYCATVKIKLTISPVKIIPLKDKLKRLGY